MRYKVNVKATMETWMYVDADDKDGVWDAVASMDDERFMNEFYGAVVDMEMSNIEEV